MTGQSGRGRNPEADIIKGLSRRLKWKSVNAPHWQDETA
jgi:hypothetical protein